MIFLHGLFDLVIYVLARNDTYRQKGLVDRGKGLKTYTAKDAFLSPGTDLLPILPWDAALQAE